MYSVVSSQNDTIKTHVDAYIERIYYIHIAIYQCVYKFCLSHRLFWYDLHQTIYYWKVSRTPQQHLIIIAVRLCFRTKRNWQMKLVTDANISKLQRRTLAQNRDPCPLLQFGAQPSVSIATVPSAAICVHCNSSVCGHPCQLPQFGARPSVSTGTGDEPMESDRHPLSYYFITSPGQHDRQRFVQLLPTNPLCMLQGR